MASLSEAATGEPPRRSVGWLAQLAAPRWTVLFFLLTAIASLAVAQQTASATALIAAPFTLLAINLGAAIATLPRFRRDLPLLVFHLALLALVGLFILTRLTYFDATTALTQGDAFNGQLITQTRGPLHEDGISALHFINDGFSERYSGRHRATDNNIRWQDPTGAWHHTTIGGNTPLVINKYRVYTKRQRGYSPLFHWRDNQGNETLGHVQLNTTEENLMAPSNSWQLPDGTEIWAMLDLQRAPINGDVSAPQGTTNLDTETLAHSLILRLGDTRHSLLPGESLALAGGTLTYLQLDAWLGYRIVYDPAQPWIIATIAVGILSLLWFYQRQLSRRGGWDSDR